MAWKAPMRLADRARYSTIKLRNPQPKLVVRYLKSRSLDVLKATAPLRHGEGQHSPTEYDSGGTRTYRPITGEKTELEEMGYAKANAELERILESGQRLCWRIECGLISMEWRRSFQGCARRDHVRNIHLCDNWMFLAGSQTHEILATRSLYLKLDATQTLLNAIWFNPWIANGKLLSRNILNCMNPSVKGHVDWTTTRKQLTPQISIIQDNYLRYSRERAESRDSPDLLGPEGVLTATVHHESLAKAFSLLQTLDHLLVTMELRDHVARLIRLAKAVTRTAYRLLLIEERISMESDLKDSHECILELEAHLPKMPERPEHEGHDSDLENKVDNATAHVLLE
ncbi:hypothetical protein SAMD00023353_2200650 [Rosellinia necatrix]|uniref:Uncharacterized protein n=1 Tax=Rosellinia necatrix TaxID=77044 RepID=A0A1S7UNW8_ROSNE|nr:hypothetical protein SAMD00023353_2200650 [Rosellinia necatrix]